MNYVLLTEGTGKGVHERTNVSVLAEACVQDGAQCVHLEKGPGTVPGAVIIGHLFGMGALHIAIRHYEWLAQRYNPKKGAKIFLFGFSRGALIARVSADFRSRLTAGDSGLIALGGRPLRLTGAGCAAEGVPGETSEDSCARVVSDAEMTA